MCDLTIEVLVDDAVEFIYHHLSEKDDQFRTQAADADDYDRLFKRWLSEVLCELGGKCEDFGLHRREGSTTNQLATSIDEAIDQLDPEMSRRQIVALREQLIRSRAGLGKWVQG